MGAEVNGERMILLRVISRFQAQEWVSTQDERRTICLACRKSLKFVFYIEILGKQINVLLNFQRLISFLAIYMIFR